MGIFISYRSTDFAIKEQVSNYFKENGISCYSDSYDDVLSQSRGSAALTKILVNRISEYDTLFAIVTPNTKNSWWVPFEIGTARQMPRIITSYTNISESDLPEYLLEWPRLRTPENLSIFVKEYNNKSKSITASVESLNENKANYDSTYSRVRSFEQSVMDSLRQRSY